MIRHLIEDVGRNAGADRSYVDVACGHDGVVYKNLYEWCAEGVKPLDDSHPEFELSQFPDVLEQLQKGRVWSCSDIRRAHPKTREWLASQGVQALILAPFHNDDGSQVGFVGFDFVRSRPHPIPALVVRNLMEAVNRITSCLRVQREQERARKFSSFFSEMGVGIWSFELDEGALPRMYGNKAMDELLGCDGAKLTPEEYYHAWYDHIHPDHYAEVHETVKNLMAGHHAEVQYPFVHPILGEMWVRCGGRRDRSYTKGVRIIGRHQDVSQLLHMQRNAVPEVTAVQRLADYERDRADRERDINRALELLVSERDFTRVLDQLMVLWCRALGAQGIVLGEFADGGFKIVNSYLTQADASLFVPGERFPCLPEVSGTIGDTRDYIALVDFQGSRVACEMAKLSHAAPVIRNIATCHSHIVRFKGARWGSIIVLFDRPHAFSEDEMRFITLSAHGVELALLRRENSK